MASTPDKPVEQAYRRWLNADPEPGWYEPGEGHRIKTAFIAGWTEGVCYMAVQLAQAAVGKDGLSRLVEDLKTLGAGAAPPPGPSTG